MNEEKLTRQTRAQIEARDLELINTATNELKADVEDVLGYQATPGIQDEVLRKTGIEQA